MAFFEIDELGRIQDAEYAWRLTNMASPNAYTRAAKEGHPEAPRFWRIDIPRGLLETDKETCIKYACRRFAHDVGHMPTICLAHKQIITPIDGLIVRVANPGVLEPEPVLATTFFLR
ncbi:MAG: hypothetical protein Q7O66_16845 [Dehalococcoidia bacterium]|nr:hypothetical protein [Dehalococcoidia bacterium]